MKILLLIIFAAVCTAAYPQQQGYWTVKAGENIKSALGDSIIFRYKQFTPGYVYFRDGTVSTARLNVNFVNGEMQFINGLGDTMTVTNEGTTQYVAIEKDTFYFDKISKGFVELVYANAKATLAKQLRFMQGDIKKVGAYDQASSTSSINSASYFSNGNQTARLNENKVLVLHKQTTYFIGDNFNHFLPASKKNVLKMFNQKEAAIDTYLEQHKQAFAKEEELVGLIDLLGM